MKQKKIPDLPKQVSNPTKKPSHREVKSQSSFSDHIAELRRRIFFILFIFIAASSLAYNYRDILLGIIMAPLEGAKLIYLTPGGGFNFMFQISMYAGLLAAAPMLIYQLYKFIRPALPKRAQRSSGTVVFVAFLLMLCGVAFGYFVAVPSALHFLSTFAGDAVTPNLTADSYLSFFLAYIAGLGVLFELPLLLLFLHWIHPMTPGSLLKSERFVILFSFVAAALITPTPDMLNQGMIAIPLILIYQLGVVAVLIAIRRDHKKHTMQKLKTLQGAAVETDSLHIAVKPKVTLSPQPIAAVAQSAPIKQATSVSRPRPRGIDGFARQKGSMPTPRPQSRLAAPVRPNIELPRSRPRPVYRRPLSIDGFPVS